VLFVPGVAVSGSARWDRRSSQVRARLTVRSSELTGRFRISSSTSDPNAVAAIRGRFGGAAVAGTLAVPRSAAP
jgi:hypothetical protein